MHTHALLEENTGAHCAEYTIVSMSNCLPGSHPKLLYIHTFLFISIKQIYNSFLNRCAFQVTLQSLVLDAVLRAWKKA